MNSHSKRVCNLTIKISILASKFLLMMCLAKTLKVYELGIYGLVQSIVVYYMYFSGIDLYTYTTREYIRKNDDTIIIKHIKAIILLSILGISICYIISNYVDSIQSYIPFILSIAILEHYNQEIGRLLIAKNLQLKASIQLFVRSALWCYIIAIITFSYPEKINLLLVFKIWMTFSLISLIYGYYLIVANSNITFSMYYSKKLDLNWFINAIKTSILFFIGTLAVRTIFIVDKAYFDYMQELNSLGIYIFYSSFTGVFLSFCDSAIFQFSYPRLIRLYKDKKIKLIKNEMFKMLMQCLFLSFLFILGSYFLLEKVITLIGNQEYINSINIFWYLLSINILLCYSNIFHYIMYAFNLDFNIMIINILNLLFFSIFLFIGKTFYFTVMNSIILALLMSTLSACILKIYYVYKVYMKSTQEF